MYIHVKRRWRVLILLMLSALIFSCAPKKEEEQTNDEQEVISESTTMQEVSPTRALRLAIARQSPTDQRSIFSGLKPELKSALWRDRLDELAAEADASYKDLFNDIKERLTPEVYKDSMARTRFWTFWEDGVERMTEVYEGDTLVVVVTFNKLANLEYAEETQTRATPECNCSTTFSGDIRAGNCHWYDETCEAGNCTRTSFGCGHFWLWACNGLCTDKPDNN